MGACVWGVFVCAGACGARVGARAREGAEPLRNSMACGRCISRTHVQCACASSFPVCVIMCCGESAAEGGNYVRIERLRVWRRLCAAVGRAWATQRANTCGAARAGAGLHKCGGISIRHVETPDKGVIFTKHA